MKLTMNGKQLAVLAAAALIVGAVTGAFAGAGPAFANGTEKCPAGWDGKVDSGDLSTYPVDGAVDYCFKAGPYTTDSIPAGGFGQDGACTEDHIERCGLSHWVWYLGDSTPTPELPTATPTPTDVEPTPTDTPVEPTPTPEEPTPTPEEPTPTPTDEPEPTPTELPRTGSPLTPDYNIVWQEDWLPNNLYLAHNGMGAGENLGLEWLMLRANSLYNSVYLGNVDYWVWGRLTVEAGDMSILDFVESWDGIVLMTCSGYQPDEDYWEYRVFIFLEAVQ